MPSWASGELRSRRAAQVECLRSAVQNDQTGRSGRADDVLGVPEDSAQYAECGGRLAGFHHRGHPRHGEVEAEVRGRVREDLRLQHVRVVVGDVP
jgi:hypothetical protein